MAFLLNPENICIFNWMDSGAIGLSSSGNGH